MENFQIYRSAAINATEFNQMQLRIYQSSIEREGLAQDSGGGNNATAIDGSEESLARLGNALTGEMDKSRLEFLAKELLSVAPLAILEKYGLNPDDEDLQAPLDQYGNPVRFELETFIHEEDREFTARQFEEAAHLTHFGFNAQMSRINDYYGTFVQKPTETFYGYQRPDLPIIAP